MSIISHKQMEREFGKQIDDARDALKAYGKKFEPKDIRSVKRRALKPMVKAYRDEIKPLGKGSTAGREEFTIKRGGDVYADITPGQLKKSMGVITDRQAPNYTAVGPRVKMGNFKDAEKGGWFAHFLNYGGLIGGDKKNGGGTPYRGANYKFAERAAAKGKGKVYTQFVQEVKRKDLEVKKELGLD